LWFFSFFFEGLSQSFFPFTASFCPKSVTKLQNWGDFGLINMMKVTVFMIDVTFLMMSGFVTYVIWHVLENVGVQL